MSPSAAELVFMRIFKEIVIQYTGSHVGSSMELFFVRELSWPLSRNGVSGAAGKQLLMKSFRDEVGVAGTVSGFRFLGWDSGKRKRPPVVYIKVTLR